MTTKLKNELLCLTERKTIIKKPMAKGIFKIKGIGIRRNEEAIIYSIPNHNNPQHPYEKGITFSEFSTVIKQLDEVGFITRDWFNKNLPNCAKEGTCNYTSLCGILENLGYVKYLGNKSGKYIRSETK